MCVCDCSHGTILGRPLKGFGGITGRGCALDLCTLSCNWRTAWARGQETPSLKLKIFVESFWLLIAAEETASVLERILYIVWCGLVTESKSDDQRNYVHCSLAVFDDLQILILASLVAANS